MSNEVELVIAVWEAVRDHLPHQKRADIAKDMLYAFSDFGFEPAELASILDEDPDLNAAFDEVYPPPDYDDDEDESDE
jgi:hypothetical protein